MFRRQQSRAVKSTLLEPVKPTIRIPVLGHIYCVSVLYLSKHQFSYLSNGDIRANSLGYLRMKLYNIRKKLCKGPGAWKRINRKNISQIL